MESCHIVLLSDILDFVPCDLQLQRGYSLSLLFPKERNHISIFHKSLADWLGTAEDEFSHDFSVKAHANGRNKSQRCCVLLGFFGQQCCVRLHGPKSLIGFKLYC